MALTGGGLLEMQKHKNQGTGNGQIMAINEIHQSSMRMLKNTHIPGRGRDKDHFPSRIMEHYREKTPCSHPFQVDPFPGTFFQTHTT